MEWKIKSKMTYQLEIFVVSVGVGSALDEVLKEQLVAKDALHRSDKQSKHVEVITFRALQCSDKELSKGSPLLEFSDLHNGAVMVHEILVINTEVRYLCEY